MRTLRNLIAGLLLVGVSLGLSACAQAEIVKPDIKAKTSACLIRSATIVPGTPEKQLAADLVEAKIVYGIGVREVKIDQRSEQVPTRLLQALDNGCVLIVSANPDYLSDLANFASEHPRMMVLFVGGEISSAIQPPNLRWVADDALSGARLAGFFAANKSETQIIHLFMQPVYWQGTNIKSSFTRGVKDFDELSGTKTQIVFTRTSSAKALSDKLSSLNAKDIAAVFGGKSIWLGVKDEGEDLPYLIGADLQLDNSELPFGDRVQASVERITNKYVLNAVSALINREFAAEPLYRKPGALKFKSIELRLSQPDSIDGAVLSALETYRQSLITPTK